MKLLLAVVIILMVISVGVWLKARSNEAVAQANYPPEGQFLSVGSHRIHFVDMGPSPSLPSETVPQTIVLIHGSSGSTRDMTFRLAPELATRYRVIVFDRPGLGYSDPVSPSGASITEQAEILSEAAQQLGARDPIVVGHSYGGAVALAWAVEYPDRMSGLVALSAASHPWDTGLTTYYKILSHPVLGPIVIPLIAALVGDARVERELEKVFDPDTVPEGYTDHFGPELTLRRSAMRANALQRRDLLDEIKALSPRYPEIQMPMEILHGDADFNVWHNVHSVPLSKAVEGADLRLLKDKGHMIQHTAVDAVIDAIDRAATRAR